MSGLQGYLRKMRAENGTPVQYQLRLDDHSVPLNSLLGTSIQLHFTGIIRCVHCSRSTKKSFNQGYCYPCFRKLAACDSCIVSPEKCHFHLGTCREPAWGETNCMMDHLVYLAHTSGPKVGITRITQAPTRWLDQGAVAAVPMLRVGSRYLSGLVERTFAKAISDRTQWRAMLKPQPEVDLMPMRDTLLQNFRAELERFQSEHGLQSLHLLEEQTAEQFEYPILSWPDKIMAINAEQHPDVSGTLLGIKGQYLLLDTGVINLRKYGGYELSFRGEGV
jgi:hypothetical protein